MSMRELIIKEASHLVFLACMVFENSDEYQSTGSSLLKIIFNDKLNDKDSCLSGSPELVGSFLLVG